MTVQRRTRKPASYTDLTVDSDEEVMPLTTSKLQNKRKRVESPSEESDVPDLEEEEYEVEYIVKSRLKQYGKKVVLEYFIHWKNYPEEERTWTLADQFDDDDPPVVAFYEKNPRAPRRGQDTPFSLLMGKKAATQTPVKKAPKPAAKATKPAKAPAPGKENRAIKKPRVDESDEDEFVPPEDDDVKDDDDDDYDDAVASESDGPADDFDEEDEDSEPSKPAKVAKKTHGSWGVANKGQKKAAVKLSVDVLCQADPSGSFRPKIKPLNIKESTGAAHSANEALPPIHDIPAMFDHMVSRVPTIVDVVKRLNGRKLRVATMCSGTESPLLALNMIAKSMEEQYDVKLNVEHVFSCEIEPFKQAYIERNFRPPILFRDVTELGRKKAHTAYGSLVDVPGNVDLLIAGTSCVDYSGLNNVKQDIDANGESGRTFRGMLQWVNKHRPPVVLLENVCSAPWDKVVQYFGEINYDANYVRLDTKEFYIPHTRTRVYLYATPMEGKKAEHLPEKWMETVKALRRPWSSSFEAFLLPADHPDIHRARLDLAAAKYYNDGSQRKPTDWGRCESRHARARQEEELGNLRPLTAWKEAGVCKGLDWTWNDWLQAQTERVVDLLEISTLRMAKEGIDSGFKACIWNVSQNVDRQTGSSRTALAQCLTPNMIPSTGIAPTCYARNVQLGTQIVFQPVHIAALAMTLIMLFHVRSKYTAVGRKEIVLFFYIYMFVELLGAFLDSSVIPTSNVVYPWFTAIYAGAIGALPLRKLLLRPVARMRLDPDSDNVLSGDWEVCVPSEQEFRIEVTGCGDKVPTWQASLGLQGKFVGNERWSKVNVHVPPEAERALDRDVSGIYTLLPRCGQNQASLHKQEGDSDEPLFFYLNADRVGNSSDDQYVFSTSIERVDYGTERDIVASLDRKWRESTRTSETPKLHVTGGWVVATEAKLTAVQGTNIAVDDVTAHADEATFAIPSSSEVISNATSDCDQSVAILSVTVPLDAKHAESMWTKGTWGQVDLDREGNTTFANLAWITERLPPLDSFSSWSVLNDSKSTCLKCAPRPPTIHWIKQSGKFDKAGRKTTKTMSTVIAFEDRKEAGVYEYPFSVQLRLDDGTGSFRIGLNPSSLAHRAMARLPHAGRDDVVLSWRLVTSLVAEEPQPPRVFLLPSNKRDPQHPQPEGFLLPLRKEQLRSLWWMLQQEKAPGKTHTFVEEEISEAALPALGWRAEGKAERPVMVRGGVIADQVGYGKTIISLALVAETRNEIDGDTPEPPGLIDVRATLIIVPGHLSKQWPSEIERFTGKMFRTVVIQTMKDLANVSIADISKADIVIMAAEVFDSDVYWERFEYLGAQPEGWLNDKQGGRFFGERLDTALETLRQETEALKDGADNAVALMKDLHQKSKQDAQNKRDELRASNFGKRLKGAAYRDKYDATQPQKTKKKSASGSRWEVDDDDEEDDGSEDMAIPAPSFRDAKGTESYSSANRPLAAVLRLSSCYKWVLSGTPPVDDFASIRTIATFMGIHLGVEDDAEGSAQAKKARMKEQTAAERFHAFRETHSAAWHRRRDDLAQEFLNTFVRQNIAEIDDIPTTEHIHSIRLPARKETKFKNVTVGDRNARLEEALADSKTAEEALLKRCCHFTLDLTNRKFDAKTAQEACEHIASARRAQLLACEEDLRRTINNAVALHAYVKKKNGFNSDERQPFKEWAKLSFDVSKHDGDVEAAERLIAVLESCGFEKGAIPGVPADSKASKVSGKPEDVKWELREQTHLLRRLAKELVGRVRSLRFFEVVRNLQLRGDEATAVLEGSECGHTRSDDKMAILSCCGHVACLQCMTEAVNNQKCVKPDSCHAPVRHTNIVKVSTLGVEGELSSGRYGAKLQRLVDLIRSIPKKERILVFLQWDDLMAKVSEALDAGGIGHVTLAGGVKAKANTLDAFQKGNSARVLVLKMNDASAAGSNLTMANHAIFIGPLFTPTLLNYRSTETQAIGRVRRFGQEKKVHIHRLLVQDTIDYTIFNARTKELSEKADYVALPRGEYVPGAGRKSRITEDVIEIEDEL
ncbi:DNA repair protein rad8 [Trichosporon asahii var. asahii CBS 8904]|uniref:DNA repair protein rad8 n=1 Tax=Trichosporon asahii var. asahii (strain CBS 8904) TaxID=1220162 RepID=K1VYA4_TRIAC|nr:DNA repair protein rad8 [Trichosporon asahii var. asahii CBS 8904]